MEVRSNKHSDGYNRKSATVIIENNQQSGEQSPRQRKGNDMYKVFGEIPTAYFDSREEAERYATDWQDGCEAFLFIVIAYQKGVA